MLYNWSASPYRSPQHDVAAVVVVKTSPITIEHLPSGQLLYTYDGFREGDALWWTEGFEDGRAIDDWFRPLVKKGGIYEGHLMTFSLANADSPPLLSVEDFESACSADLNGNLWEDNFNPAYNGKVLLAVYEMRYIANALRFMQGKRQRLTHTAECCEPNDALRDGGPKTPESK